MSLITIEQLLESVDLDFEPRFVTKDKSGLISIWADKPSKDFASNAWIEQTEFVVLPRIKLADFANKPWQECIYEVPRKTTGKIEKFELNDCVTVENVKHSLSCVLDSKAISKLNALVDMVNNIISVQEKMIDSRFVVEAVNKLKGAKNE